MSEFRRRGNPALEFGGQEQAQRRSCDWPGCACPGEYRAPRSRARLREFYLFCLDHVRAYNRAWDFFSGMSQHEIEAYLREDVTWHRPTWPIGNGAPLHGDGWRWQDPYELFLNGSGTNGTQGASEWDRRERRLGRTERMLAVLDLPADATLQELKARYKQLAKRHHPDLHGGDKNAEERLKLINEAYTYLMDSERFG
jgi:hypothetical protein